MENQARAFLVSIRQCLDNAQAPTLPQGLEVALASVEWVPALIDASLNLACERETQRYKAVAAHLADPKYATAYPLHLQEYSCFVGDQPRAALPIWSVMQQATWPQENLQGLLTAEGVVEVEQTHARALWEGLAGIVDEAAQLVQQIDTLKAWKEQHQLNVVQGEACLVASLCREDFVGAKVIDLGCAEGAIVGYFQSRGASAAGTDIEADGATPTISSDNFMSLPAAQRFDVITATGFFESGAFVWPDEGETNTPRYYVECDQLLGQVAASLAPEGLLIIRNFTEPISFRDKAIANAGLVYQHVLAPTAASQWSGRAACFTKK